MCRRNTHHCRLVKNQQTRFVNKCHGERYAPLLTARQVLALTVGVGEVEELDEKVAARTKLGVRNIVEARVEFERLANCEITKQGDLLWHVADELQNNNTYDLENVYN